MNGLISCLLKGQAIDTETLQIWLDKLRLGHVSEVEIASFLSLFSVKGNCHTDNLFLLLNQIRQPLFNTLGSQSSQPVIDIVGTGGDGANTLNISTVSSIIVASSGIKVAKHGNRSISSKCGSADLLEAWGIKLTHEVDYLLNCLDQVGITFFLATHFNPTFGLLGPVRKKLGFPTCFNKLGPFLNPCQLTHTLIGVADPDFLKPAICLLQKQGYQRAAVVHCCGLDELTTIGENQYYLLDQGKISYHTLDPTELGFSLGNLKDLQGNYAETNKIVLGHLLEGKHQDLKTTLLETIILNVGFVLYLVGKTDSLLAGCQLARQYTLSGQGGKLLAKWKGYQN